MLESKGVILLAMLVVAIGVGFLLRKKKQKQLARELAEWLEQKTRELVRVANGEYLNYAKAERFLFSEQTTYPMETEHWPEFHVKEDPAAYATNYPSKSPDSINKINEYFVENHDLINKINESFVEKRLAESKNLFDKLELTKAQRLAVVRDEDANLINAGAGSGKTRTILGKVEYLIARGLAKPAEILIVVYSKKIEQEIKKKIEKINPNITVSTFHALGMEIMRKVESERVSVSSFAGDNKLGNFLSKKMKGLLKIPKMHHLLIDFFSTHCFEDNPEQEVKTKDEYFRKIRYVGLRSLDGQPLKSHQEVQIANWLILNGIKWEYERNYPHNDSKKQHKPDFYLPDYDLWIEHFGIDEYGNTAPWVEKEKYNRDIEWKRAAHAKNQTELVETYSYESNNSGGLPQALKEKLIPYGVKKTPVSDHSIDLLVKENFKPTSNFIKLIMQFLSLSRENKLSQKKLGKRIVSARDGAFLMLFKFFRKSYEKMLKDEKEIDFTDMIVRGLKHVETGRYKSCYKYILVDEYQDITKVRLDFLLAMQKQVDDARLFCVGDDWQSIYQFQGANVSLITDFKNHVGAMQQTDLDKTFRYSQKVSDFSSTFITQNPAQLKKEISSSTPSAEHARPIRIIYHDPEKQQAELEKVVDLIARGSHENERKCLVLGRYNHNKPDGWTAITNYAKPKGVDMEFSTIHKSKGRESDWVVVLENKSDLKGYSFPSEIQNDPVLKMVLPQQENFPDAEERRLFYVAVTRTRRGVFLLAPTGKASDFIQEIDPRPTKEAVGEFAHSIYAPFVYVADDTASTILFCPECKGQTIQKKSNSDGGFFYACSHFPSCRGKLPTCANKNCDAAVDLKEVRGDTHICECGHSTTICPRCKCGILEKRDGQYGEFWGCSRFSVTECKYTKNIPSKN